MEGTQHFRDLHDLLHVEDYIALKLETPWPRDSSLPDGCSLGDDSGFLLVTSQNSLVAASSALCQERISGALFAGCAAFNTSDLFETAAREILSDAEEICIVHNRDTVYKLIRMFPNAKVLALPHDLGKHALEIDEPCRDLWEPLVESSELRQLVGSVEGQRDGCLFSKRTVQAILLTCPLICRIDTANFMASFLRVGCLAIPATCPQVKNFTHLRLLTVADRHCPALEVAANTADVTLAAKTFTRVEHLVVAVRSVEAIVAVSGFRHLRSLSLKLAPRIHFADVDSKLQRLLKSWPRLEKLSLEWSGGLRLSTIARLCPQLESLSLVDSKGAMDDVALEADAFPNLESVELNVTLPICIYDELFMATSGRLRRVRLFGDECSAIFLLLCWRRSERISFGRLEELTLGTARTVRELGLEPECLHDVMKTLPALRRLETDSYDLRLFVDYYRAPLGRVSLNWCECVHCIVSGVNVQRR